MPLSKKSVLVACALTLAAISGAAAQSVSISIPNFSFENPTISNNNSNTNFTGWVGSGGQATGVENPSGKFTGDNTGGGTLPSPADGVNAAFINTGGSNGFGTITSGASLATIAGGTNYTLTVAVGNAAGGGTQLPGSFSLSLLANGVSVATTGLIDGNTITDGTFADFTTGLSATVVQSAGLAGQSLTIQLLHQNTGPNANAQIFFDNVQLTSALAIPEPGTYALFLGIFGGLFAFGRRHFARLRTV